MHPYSHCVAERISPMERDLYHVLQHADIYTVTYTWCLQYTFLEVKRIVNFLMYLAKVISIESSPVGSTSCANTSLPISISRTCSNTPY